jgi:TIGR03009 family protein
MFHYACIAVACACLCFTCTAALPAHDKQSQPQLPSPQQLAEFTAAIKNGLLGPEPKQPDWHPLEPKAQVWVDELLAYWEMRTKKLKTLQCNFHCWEYDRHSAPQPPNALPNRYSTGIFKYAGPDMGLFSVRESAELAGATSATNMPRYNAAPENLRHWQTNGERVVSFDYRTKEVNEFKIPPNLREKAFTYGSFPLAGMLGLSSKTLRTRYWIRPVQTENAGEYCLEAISRSQPVWGDFQVLQIILDEKQFLPTKIQFLERNWLSADYRRTVYSFENRTENTKFDPSEFSEFKIPLGWKHTVRDLTQ